MKTVKQPNINELWIRFEEKKSLSDKHKLILEYVWLVKHVLRQMTLPSNTILNEDDFLNVGILGLHETIERYDTSRGVKFESYAIPRIRGIIQDELRKLDWLSRTARKKAHDYIHAGDELRSQVGREVSSEEIMKKLGVTPEQYNSYLAAAAAAKASLSLGESQSIHLNEDEIDILEEVQDTSQTDTLTNIENNEQIDFIANYMKTINERKRLVMTLYYYEELTFKEIGKVLSVSESRICQIHTQVVADLREQLNEFDK